MTVLADLDAMDRAGLAALWSEHLGGCVPPKMSQTMQRRFIAFALQAKLHGDLPPALAARLDRIAAGEERKAAPTLRPGGRLLRAWNGTTHVVDVVADGYLWNGVRHRSLSAIARAITGARWSGPRFFGVVERAGTGPGEIKEGSSKVVRQVPKHVARSLPVTASPPKVRATVGLGRNDYADAGQKTSTAVRRKGRMP